MRRSRSSTPRRWPRGTCVTAHSRLLLLPEAGRPRDAKGEGEEGLLTARDILGVEVEAELVVLSACYSGLGDRSPMPGDDLYGLQRALLQAGANTIVSGLWDVY